MELKFDERGLIPAIVQDHYTKEVLTLAYMNAESLALTIDERRTCFWSRSRQELWRKVSFWLVMAAAITVGLKRLPTSFWIISTGRTPPCSEPTTGLRSA